MEEHPCAVFVMLSKTKVFLSGTQKPKQPWEGNSDLCTKVPAPPPFTTELCRAQQTFTLGQWLNELTSDYILHTLKFNKT